MRTIKNLDATDFIINLYEQLARWRSARNARNVGNEEFREAVRTLPEGTVLRIDIPRGDIHAYD